MKIGRFACGPTRCLSQWARKLDPPSNGGATWVSALTGQIESIRPLLAGLVASAERELTVDAPPEPSIQQILDDLECTPAGPDDRYVILEGPAS